MSQSINTAIKYIDDFQQFTELCELAKKQSFIAVDTEFMRQNTYYAELCLVQIGFDNNAFCIDVLAIDDLKPLANLFEAESVVKVFHSCRQDFEVLLQRLGVLPRPIFDTQLAAAFCGYDAQAGYAKVVSDECGVELDKSQTRTDWSRRPLSTAQINYAADDVTYLCHIYQILLQRLESEKGYLAWYEQEIDALYLEDYDCHPSLAYKRFNGMSMPVKSQHFLVALAEWREQYAQKKNIPRTWVLKDKEMYEIAALQIKSANDLHHTELWKQKSIQRHIKSIINLSNNSAKKVEKGLVWESLKSFDSDEKELVKLHVKRISELSNELGIAQSTLATRKDIEAFLRNKDSSKVAKGWRSKCVLPVLDK